LLDLQFPFISPDLTRTVNFLANGQVAVLHEEVLRKTDRIIANIDTEQSPGYKIEQTQQRV